MKINRDRMRRAREAAGLSKSELARRIGTSYMTVHRVERGSNAPGADVLGAWALACGVSVDSLYGEDAGEAA